MKNYLKVVALLVPVCFGVSQAQTATDSWDFGVGLTYPRFYSVNITSLNTDFGAYLSGQRNFSENVGIRLKGGYSHFEGQWNDASMTLNTETTNLMAVDLDLLYYPAPCSPVSPYLFAGLGGIYKGITNGQAGNSAADKVGSQLNIGGGAEFRLNPQWNIVTEFSYHVTGNSGLDGTFVPAELNGRDSYMILSAGINIVFGKGRPSKLCGMCNETVREARDPTDYGRIEEMIVKHMPKEITKDVIVDRYIMSVSNDKLVLVGVNFEFDKSDLLTESYAVLDKAVTLLGEKPAVNVEIEGYTDYIGTWAYNQGLSVDRAQKVKDYLVSKGIAAGRLTTVGYGKNNPVENNKTEEGRAMNRRIVFKIM